MNAAITDKKKKVYWIFLNITGFVLNMTGFVLNMTGLVLNMTGFVLIMNGFVLNMTWWSKLYIFFTCVSGFLLHYGLTVHISAQNSWFTENYRCCLDAKLVAVFGYATKWDIKSKAIGVIIQCFPPVFQVVKHRQRMEKMSRNRSYFCPKIMIY